MAEAGVMPGLLALGQNIAPALPSADELREIREYEKVVQFRDLIVSGKHPKFKPPNHAIAKPSPSTQGSASTQPINPLNGYQVGNQQSSAASFQHTAASSSVSDALGLGNPGFNPLLLEKSDDLVKAELQLQRQRIERILKDQVDQRRTSSRAALQSADAPVDLDLSDILAKALTVVQATAPAPLPAVAGNEAERGSEASDSFDENTFYSSQHDTPEPTGPTNTLKTPEGAQKQAATNSITVPGLQYASQPPNARAAPSTSQPSNQPSTQMTVNPVVNALPVPVSDAAPAAQQQTRPRMAYTYQEVPGLGRPPVGQNAHVQMISPEDSGPASRSGDSGNTDSDQAIDQSAARSQQLLRNHVYSQGQPPLVRAHNLSPFAPQPSHVSPLAVARQPPVPDNEITILSGAPAPVRALRQVEGAATSPESSPQGERGSRKNKKRKNKRKSDARGAEAPDGSPYIKPEPRSPSPLAAPQFARPNKRQRQSQRQQQELTYDEPRFEEPPLRMHQESHPAAPLIEQREVIGYTRIEDPYARSIRHSIAPPGGARLERPLYEERRIEEPVQYIRRQPSPSAYSLQYVPGDPRPLRSATFSAIDTGYREVPAYHHEGRTSARPQADRARSRSPVIIERPPPAMAPPDAPKIIYDQYGRRYIEPPRPSSSVRPSFIPAARPAEPEIIYDRPPLRATSRVPGPETFEDNGVIYRRVSPGWAPRRVITQPEPRVADLRGYREREYSVRPVPGGEDFVEYRGAIERGPPDEMRRTYITRASTVRPSESIPFDYARVHSVRPDVPNREYAASVHPEARRAADAPVARGYSVRPDMPRREYSVRPVERFYERPIHQDDDVTYIEHPPAAQREVAYAPEGAGELYHR